MAYREAVLSTMALYKWDNSLFDKFKVPNGIDKATAVNTILINTAELSVIYTNPDKLKEMIGIWSIKNFDVWQKLYDSTQFEYNPIWNYDRTEEYSDSYNDSIDHDKVNNRTENFTRDLGENAKFDSTNTREYTDDVKNQIAAFNNGMTDNSTNHSSGDGTETVDSTNNVSQTGTTNTTINDTDKIGESRGHKGEHNLRAYGNIGVTTTQQMIEQEREVVKFNIIDYIANDYMSNFCIMLY